MISSNTRASRSASRYSSPAQPPGRNWNGPSESKASGNEGSRALMARWLEPSVQTKTSFEEAGLMRYGVLENMAPLGTMPKPKKPGGENGSTVRKIILRPSGAGLANAAREAKAGSNHPPPPKSPPRSPPPLVQPLPPRRKSLPPKDREPEDDEYDPKGGARRRRSKRVSLPAKKMRQTPDGDPKDSVVMAKAPTPKATSPKKRHAPLEPEEREFADKVVEAAVDEALKHYRYPTAWAMRTLYDEKCDDADFVAMVEDVFRQTADAETRNEFSRLVEQKKREGKKDDQGCYYFVPPTTNNRFTPHKPKPAPYASLLREAEGEEQTAGDRRAAKRARTSHAATPRKTASSGAVVVNVRTPRSSRSNKHARRDSGSSISSSLSSAMSLSSPEGSAASLSPSLRGAAAGEASGAQAHRHADAPKSQPITTRGRSRPRHASTAADDATSMPGRLAATELFPNLPAKTAKHGTAKAPPMLDDDEDPFWDRRRDARKVTGAYSAQESSVRTGQEERVATPPRTTRRTRQLLAAPVSTRATRSASKRPIADVERTTSPAAFSWQGDGSPAVGSRAATPPMLRPAKKQRTGLRVKTSPVKKKGGTAAGVPRSMSEANSTLNNGAPKDPTSDNDEYCSACGNAGDVVCCDGCPRSFHFECVDMVQSDDLPDEWYCNECLIRRFPSRVPVHKGIFAGALNNLEKSIPRAFSLPKKVQNRFEGVRAGADGDYEDVMSSKAVKCRKRNGYDELPDFFKQREDGHAVLCHACQKPATEIRAIIPCSACPFHWHIDCLDPPLAMPPVLKTWRCPAHIDDVLIEVPGLAPAHRFRRLKGTQTIAPAISRGLKNNGHIEIDWTDEPVQTDRSGWPDPSSFGRSYKLPARGVVLDFIEQLRHQGAGYGSRRHESRRVPYPSPPAQRDASSPLPGSALERDIDEMQASLTLIGLRQKRSEPIDRLTSALMSAADDNILSLMAKSNADNIAVGHLTQDDRMGLRALLAQIDAMGARIRQVLGDDKPAPEPSAVSADARTPVSEPPSINESGKLEPIAPVAEPTPPSTVDHAEGSMELD
ncbi:PHD-finger domain-containing protein [Hirsutella rhossiliensis]|uniref:PHD-finger domain-containing protein n=1 Tax=Hirsutella rhossiliensis TaxID=111463 RepID=A0A9P8N1L7_9HYPO|nr:PHD-finger domain-containing protein [Hirsutella rhossiliensis]KAH0963042.1 PHD-finger domain-containing protein [Hirsutella rhossiliensis]